MMRWCEFPIPWSSSKCPIQIVWNHRVVVFTMLLKGRKHVLDRCTLITFADVLREKVDVVKFAC